MSEYRRVGSPSSPDSLLNISRRNKEVAKALKTGPSTFNPTGLPQRRLNPDEISLNSSEGITTPGAQGHENAYVAHVKNEDMSKPVLFYGKPNQIDEFATFCKVKFIADQTIAEEAKAGYAASLFRGPALQWLTNYLVQNQLDDFEELIAQIRAAFGLSTQAQAGQYARQLSRCRQNKSVQQYALEFTTLAEKVGLPEAAKKAQFVQGLKGNIQRAIISSDDYQTFDDLKTESIRIDSELYNVTRRTGSSFTGQRSGRDSSGRFKSRKPKQERD